MPVAECCAMIMSTTKRAQASSDGVICEQYFSGFAEVDPESVCCRTCGRNKCYEKSDTRRL